MRTQLSRGVHLGRRCWFTSSCEGIESSAEVTALSKFGAASYRLNLFRSVFAEQQHLLPAGPYTTGRGAAGHQG